MPGQRRLLVGSSEVEGHRRLARVHGRVEPRIASPGPVDAGGRLDLDDPGTGPGQQPAHQRPGPQGGQIGHHQSGQGRHRRGRPDAPRADPGGGAGTAVGPAGIRGRRPALAQDGQGQAQDLGPGPELGAFEPAHAGFEHGPTTVGYRGGLLEEGRDQLPVGRAGHGGGDPAVGRPHEAGGPATADPAAAAVAGDGGPLDHQGEGVHPHRPAQPCRTPGDVGGEAPATSTRASGPPSAGPSGRPVRYIIPDPAHALDPSVEASNPSATVVSFGRRPQYARGADPHHRLGTIVEMDPVRLSGPAFADLLETGGVYGLVIDAGRRRPWWSTATTCPTGSPGGRWSASRPWPPWWWPRWATRRSAAPTGPTSSSGRDDAQLGAVLATVADSPLASTTLAVLLRTGPHRSVPEGLVAESAAYGLLQGGPEFARWRAGHPARARPEPAGLPVRVSRQDQVLSITLDRPHVLNAFDAAMRDHLVAALEVAAADPSVTTVILRGAGESFCSGGDLDEFGSRPDPVTAHLVRLPTQRRPGPGRGGRPDHGPHPRLDGGLGYRAGGVRPSGGGPGRHPDRPPRGAARPRPRRRGDGQPAPAHRAPRHHAAGCRSRGRSTPGPRWPGAWSTRSRTERRTGREADPCGFCNHRVMI